MLQPISHSALGSVAKETGDEATGDSLCSDTAEASYKLGCITKELSDMVHYTEPIKFNGFKVLQTVIICLNDQCIMILSQGGGANLKCTQMYSMSENSAKKSLKKTPLEFLTFNESHLSRIYPSATRLNSSNFDPGSFWMLGSQMVALNYQTNGTENWE